MYEHSGFANQRTTTTMMSQLHVCNAFITKRYCNNMCIEFKWLTMEWKHCLAMQLTSHNLTIQMQKPIIINKTISHPMLQLSPRQSSIPTSDFKTYVVKQSQTIRFFLTKPNFVPVKHIETSFNTKQIPSKNDAQTNKPS